MCGAQLPGVERCARPIVEVDVEAIDPAVVGVHGHVPVKVLAARPGQQVFKDYSTQFVLASSLSANYVHIPKDVCISANFLFL